VRWSVERSELFVAVGDEADLPVLVVRVQAWLTERGVSPGERARITTAASELATNIVKYAGRGSMRVTAVRRGLHEGVELWAEDRGPGIADVTLALADRYSSSGSLGLGLPGVRRLMDDFDLRTSPETGTSVKVCRWLA
jgi:serine/threonine-protein kinase RsbT